MRSPAAAFALAFALDDMAPLFLLFSSLLFSSLLSFSLFVFSGFLVFFFSQMGVSFHILYETLIVPEQKKEEKVFKN